MKSVLRYFFAYLLALLYGFPYRGMKIIGITGTDGKTTTCHLLYHLLRSRGVKVGLLSTIESVYFDGKDEQKLNSFWSKLDMPLKRLIKLPFARAFNEGQHVTTAWAPTIQYILYQLKKLGCEYVILESTSHAFAQERLAGINYSAVGITNIDYEHLDYHKTFENYLKAKSKIFRKDKLLPGSGLELNCAFINADNELSQGFVAFAKDWRLERYSLEGKGDVNATCVHVGVDGIEMMLDGVKFNTSLVGKYNAYNITLALSLMKCLGYPLSELTQALAQFRSPKGRFERFTLKQHGDIVVDFAHTPQSYEKLFDFLVSANVKGRIISVFGCAGLRDASKRSKMGYLAGKNCWLCVLTSEDPRTERIEDIFSMIEEGLIKAGSKKVVNLEGIGEGRSYCVMPDRREAIERAISISRPGDIVLILGKGHEESMCFGEVELPWSDQSVVKEYIAKKHEVVI